MNLACVGRRGRGPLILRAVGCIHSIETACTSTWYTWFRLAAKFSSQSTSYRAQRFAKHAEPLPNTRIDRVINTNPLLILDSISIYVLDRVYRQFHRKKANIFGINLKLL